MGFCHDPETIKEMRLEHKKLQKEKRGKILFWWGRRKQRNHWKISVLFSSLLFDVMCRSDLLKENGVVFLEEKELGWVDIRPNSEPNNIGPKA